MSGKTATDKATQRLHVTRPRSTSPASRSCGTHGRPPAYKVKRATSVNIQPAGLTADLRASACHQHGPESFWSMLFTDAIEVDFSEKETMDRSARLPSIERFQRLQQLASALRFSSLQLGKCKG